MAAPTVRGRVHASVGATSVTSPSGTAVGDLILYTLSSLYNDAIPTHTLQSPWTQVANQGVLSGSGAFGYRLATAWRLATVAGSQSYAGYTTDADQTSYHRANIIVVTANTFGTDSIKQGSFVGTGDPPDPPLLTLGGGRDYLVVAVGSILLPSDDVFVSVTPPTNYANASYATGTVVQFHATAERSMLLPASENPGTFNIVTDALGPDRDIAFTIGIPSPLLGGGWGIPIR